VEWHIPTFKLALAVEQLVSPDFTLEVPGFGPQSFKALLLAMDCGKGGRNAKSFRRSKGRASVMLKPSSEVPEDFPALTFRIGFGASSKNGGSVQQWRPKRSQPAVSHSFAERCCATLPKEMAEWNVRDIAGADQTLTLHVCFEWK